MLDLTLRAVTLDEFVHQVLVDGRFIADCQEAPHQVARSLGLSLPADVAGAAIREQMRSALAGQPPELIIGNQGSGIEPTKPRGPERSTPPAPPASPKPETDKPEKDRPGEPGNVS